MAQFPPWKGMAQDILTAMEKIPGWLGTGNRASGWTAVRNIEFAPLARWDAFFFACRAAQAW